MYKENLIVKNSLEKIEIFDFRETKEALVVIDNNSKLSKTILTSFNNHDYLLRVIIGHP